MARHYSTREFFQQVPNALLARYFDAKRGADWLQFFRDNRGQLDPLFDSWEVLPETQRNPIDVEFRVIFRGLREKFLRHQG